MKGYKCTFRNKEKVDCNPCFFCKHREIKIYEHPCCDCIGNEDIALHRPNTETEFTKYEPRSKAHLQVLLIEQEREKMKYRIIRHYNGTKGYGRTFDTREEAQHFIDTDPKVQQDKEDYFWFDIEEVENK